MSLFDGERISSEDTVEICKAAMRFSDRAWGHSGWLGNVACKNWNARVAVQLNNACASPELYSRSDVLAFYRQVVNGMGNCSSETVPTLKQRKNTGAPYYLTHAANF